MKDAEGVNALSGLYDGHTREAVRVEEALEKINAQLIRQKEGWNRGMEYLNGLDGDGFIRQAKDMIKALKQLPSLVNGYEKKADHLNEKLKESRQEFENQEDLSSAPERHWRKNSISMRPTREAMGSVGWKLLRWKRKAGKTLFFWSS